MLFKKTVNCWFCNQYTRVPYLEANSWYCPSCEQYNGFSKDGDYNREISEQYENRRLSHRAESFQDLGNNSRNSSNNSSTFSGQNGLCESCNEMQRIKVERLAQFQPKFEWRFDKELKQFKYDLISINFSKLSNLTNFNNILGHNLKINTDCAIIARFT